MAAGLAVLEAWNCRAIAPARSSRSGRSLTGTAQRIAASPIWIRNIRVRPALWVQLGRESFTPQQRFPSEDEGLAVVTEFRHRHPGRIRLMSWILGWGDLRSDAAVRSFVRTRPFVSLRPADSS
jgi:hypothetical protein